MSAERSVAEKITLFRSLFLGRSDVFAVRWENPKTGRSGYAGESGEADRLIHAKATT